jgi:signal transduction histidine kinase
MSEARELKRRQLSETVAIHETAFLLQSAVVASNRINSVGLLLRGLCLVVIVVTAYQAADLTSWVWVLMVPILTGYLLAALEAHGQALVDWLATFSNPALRWLGVQFVAAREQAMASVSGVLEVGVGGPLALGMFIGPTAIEVSDGWRNLGVMSVVLFVAVAVAQVGSDRGYFNLDAYHLPGKFITLVRWLLPLAAAILAMGLLRWLSASRLDAWIYPTVALMFGFSLGVAYITEAVQIAALSSYRRSHVAQETDLRKLMSEEIHRLKANLGAELDVTSSPQAKRVLQRARAEVEALRRTLQEGVKEDPLSLTLAGVQEELQDIEGLEWNIDIETAGATVRAEDARLARHVVMDLVANARAVAAPRIQASVTMAPARGNWYYVAIDVADNAGGFADPTLMNSFPRGSSRWVLAELCAGRRGALSYERVAGRTIASATFRVRVKELAS